jgi:hypothetical protein
MDVEEKSFQYFRLSEYHFNELLERIKGSMMEVHLGVCEHG